MAVTIKHAKTDTIADWTQSDLDAQIAAGNYPAGTVLADIVLPSDWNNDHTISGTIPIANGGTGETTANAAINALLPSQTSNVGKVLTTDGTNTSWQTNGTGTVTSVTGTAPVSVATGTTTPVISMAAATGSVNGYLTSTDWTTFNSKAPATSGTSILYGNGSGGFSNVTVGSGLTFSTGTLSATGSMVYPGAGIPNSTGTSWGTSYTTTGSGTVVALGTNPTLYNPNIDVIDFDTTYATTLTVGQLGWDGNNTLGLGMSGGNITQQIGLQTYIYGKATSAITKGQLIKKTGSNGTSGVITFAPTTANMTNSGDIIGIAAESIALNGFGYIISTGNIKGFNTTGASSGETWADGDTIYYNPTGSGLMTNVKPSAPNIKVEVGIVINASSGGSGSVTVEIIHGSTLGGTDSNVQISGTPSNGQILTYDTSNTYWKNTSLTAGTGISVSAATGGALTVTNSAPDQTVSITGSGGAVVTGTYPNFTITTPSGTVTSVTGTAPISSTGGATPAISISQATTSTNGYLSSTDWNTFNGKQTAYTNLTTFGSLANATGWLYNNGTGTLSYSTPTAAQVGAVPTTRSLTINGTAYDLSADRTWSVGTVTSVAALTLGTSGTDLSSTVATGTTTPVITLNVPTASATNRGALSAADWTTFNNKGSGSVTTVSVASANGFAGTVANASTTPAITLTTSISGMLKGNGTAISAGTAGTDYVAPGTATTFTATQTFNGSSSTLAAIFANAAETTTVSATAATGTINYDVTTQSVLYYTTNASANFTMNFRGSSGTSLNTAMATGQTVTVVFLCTNGATAYYNNAVQVDGASVTPKYQGGSAWTSGNASSIDAYTFTIIKTGSAAFTVLTSLTQFK